jgi:hypothetical protein
LSDQRVFPRSKHKWVGWFHGKRPEVKLDEKTRRIVEHMLRIGRPAEKGKSGD